MMTANLDPTSVNVAAVQQRLSEVSEEVCRKFDANHQNCDFDTASAVLNIINALGCVSKHPTNDTILYHYRPCLHNSSVNAVNIVDLYVANVNKLLTSLMTNEIEGDIFVERMYEMVATLIYELLEDEYQSHRGT